MKRRVLSKTTPFHAVFKKKKRRTKRCRFEAALFLLLLPLDVQQGKKSFVFFPLSLPPTCLRAEVRRHPSHDEMPEQLCPASNASIGHRCRRRGRAGDVHPMHRWQWDGAGLTPLPLPL